MLSEALDITIESRHDTIWMYLSGPFNKEQIPNIRTKIEGFTRDGTRQFVIDLEKVTAMHETVADMFLGLLNFIKGKNGNIRLIYKNDVVTKAFSSYRNIFLVYPDAKSLSSNGFLRTVIRSGVTLTKKTGIRVSVPVALFLLFILAGWFISLGIIINMQKKQIEEQEAEIQDFMQWEEVTEIEIQELKSRLKPMVQLGLIPDSLSK
jgi:anti-anti-sigma regulatory factor